MPFKITFREKARGTIKTPEGPFETSADLVRKYYEFRYVCEWETENDYFEFEFTETGIGRVLIITHPDTGEDFDATDYESW